MGRSSASALRLTGEAVSSMPRPLARSGWVTTSSIANPAFTRRSSVGTAKTGVPQKTRFITAALPFASLHHLPDLALDHVAFERADMADVELSVEMIGLMQQGASQQFFAGHLEGLALEVLRARGDFACPSDLFAKLRDAQAALVRGEAAFDMNDLRVDQHDLGIGIFLRG